MWNTGNPLGQLLILPCPAIKVHGKLEEPNSDRTIHAPYPLGMNIGSPHQPERTMARTAGISL